MQRPGTETATVLETDGRTAKVITNKSKACKECGKAQAGICGKKGAGMVMTVRNPIGARQGDVVTIELDSSTQVKAWLLVFVLPVAALFLFAYVGERSGIPHLGAVMGTGALALSLFFSVSSMKRMERSSRLKISSIMGRAESREAMTQEERDYLSAYVDS